MPRNAATRRHLARLVNLARISRKAGELGFEPRLTESESVVLPLHQSPKAVNRTPRRVSGKVGCSARCGGCGRRAGAVEGAAPTLWAASWRRGNSEPSLVRGVEHTPALLER